MNSRAFALQIHAENAEEHRKRVRVIVSEEDATKEAAKLLDAAQEYRWECLTDYLDTHYEYVPLGTVVTLDCGCVAKLTDHSDPWSKATSWDWREECPEHDSTPIEMVWQSTPQLWAAVRGGYDGAVDSNCPVGYGKTVAEARADLIEKETV